MNRLGLPFVRVSLVGQRFGRLTVISEWSGGYRIGRLCLCACVCGRRREVRAVELRRSTNPTRTCGGPHPCGVCGELMPLHGEWSHRRKHFSNRRTAA